MFHLLMQKAHGFSDAEMHCTLHPNPLGHRCDTLERSHSRLRSAVPPSTVRAGRLRSPRLLLAKSWGCRPGYISSVPLLQVLWGPGHRLAAGPGVRSVHSPGGAHAVPAPV